MCSSDLINMLKAAEVALRGLRRPEDVAALRGKSVREVLPERKVEEAAGVSA